MGGICVGFDLFLHFLRGNVSCTLRSFADADDCISRMFPNSNRLRVPARDASAGSKSQLALPFAQV